MWKSLKYEYVDRTKSSLSFRFLTENHFNFYHLRFDGSTHIRLLWITGFIQAKLIYFSWYENGRRIADLNTVRNETSVSLFRVVCIEAMRILVCKNNKLAHTQQHTPFWASCETYVHKFTRFIFCHQTFMTNKRRMVSWHARTHTTRHSNMWSRVAAISIYVWREKSKGATQIEMVIGERLLCIHFWQAHD